MLVKCVHAFVMSSYFNFLFMSKLNTIKKHKIKRKVGTKHSCDTVNYFRFSLFPRVFFINASLDIIWNWRYEHISLDVLYCLPIQCSMVISPFVLLHVFTLYCMCLVLFLPLAYTTTFLFIAYCTTHVKSLVLAKEDETPFKLHIPLQTSFI